MYVFFQIDGPLTNENRADNLSTERRIEYACKENIVKVL